jgi:hypothetical protein
MNQLGVWLDLFPMILAHLSPRKRAQCRLLCKQICALISAGTVAQKFWGKDYLEFRRDIITSGRDDVKQLFLNGTWSIEMFYKIQDMLRARHSARKKIMILKQFGFDYQEGIGCVMTIVHLFCQCPEFTVGLVERLFTLDDFTNDVSVPYYREFLKSKYGLQMIREKHITLKFLESSEFKDRGLVTEFFNNPKSLYRFRRY